MDEIVFQSTTDHQCVNYLKCCRIGIIPRTVCPGLCIQLRVFYLNPRFSLDCRLEPDRRKTFGRGLGLTGTYYSIIIPACACACCQQERKQDASSSALSTFILRLSPPLLQPQSSSTSTYTVILEIYPPPSSSLRHLSTFSSLHPPVAYCACLGTALVRTRATVRGPSTSLRATLELLLPDSNLNFHMKIAFREHNPFWPASASAS